MTEDLFGGLLLFGGTIFVLASIYRAYRDKSIKGVSAFTVGFFSFINMYYTWLYLLNADKFLWSFAGSLTLGIAQLIWFSQIIYYTKLYKPREDQNEKFSK